MTAREDEPLDEAWKAAEAALVDRLMRAVEKIEQLADPPKRQRRTARIVQPSRALPDLATLAASIERRLVLLDAMTLELVVDALLDARLGVEGADGHEQRANTTYYAERFIQAYRRLRAVPA